MQLTALDTAGVVDDRDIPGFRLHRLKGREHDRWSIWVNANWRVTFEFQDGQVVMFDYESLSLVTMHNPPHPGEVYLEPFANAGRQLSEKLGVFRMSLS